MSNLLSGPPIKNFFELGMAGVVLASPGRCDFRNVGSPRNWNVLQGYGFAGASLVYAGTGLSSFEADVYIWEKQHWLEWTAFSVLLAKPKPGLPTAIPSFSLSISHPILNQKPWEIERVVVEDVGGWVQDEWGGWTTTIKFKEYKKPKPVLTKPFEGPPPVAGAAPVPVDPVEKMQAELNAQNAALRGKL